MKNTLLNMPLWQMTGEEFLALQKIEIANAGNTLIPENEHKPRFVYGLSGLQDLLGCSHATAQKAKNSSKLKGTFSQHGRKIVFDADKVLKALGRE